MRGTTPVEPGQGGTGFLVAIPVEDAPDHTYINYVVTNSHVVGLEGRSPVVRLNTITGGTAVIPLERESWVHHPDGDDVAVAAIGLSHAVHRFRPLQWDSWAITQADLDQWSCGPGDEVFYLGRFRYQEGRRRNLPTARFGSLARMPLDEGILHPRGIYQESFIVEARSLSGFSGSPVFLFVPPFSFRGDPAGDLNSQGHMFLLGIDWGHQPDLARVLGPDRKTPRPDAELWVAQNSGMMYVIPAWRIDEFLMKDDRLKEMRRLSLREFQATGKDVATLDDVGAMPTESDADEVTFAREDFLGTLDKIKQGPESPSPPMP